MHGTIRKMSQLNSKHHAACDECRRRKIKCSGEAGGCMRCQRERITCIYSSQGPMGRPKKRQRQTEEQTIHTVETDKVLADDIAVADESLPVIDFSEVAPAHDFITSTDNDSFWLAGADMDFHGEAMPSLYPLEMNSDNHMPDRLAPANDIPPMNHLVATATCNCISNMYLASSSIPADNTSYTFPQTLGPLRFALGRAQDILQCPKCDSGVGPRRQNTNFMIAVLSSVACAFDKLLRDVNTEAQRLAVLGERKRVRMGSSSPETAHLHTGGDDCPMSFNVDLEAGEWRKMAFRTVKNHINGASDDKLALEGLVCRLEARQRTWHSSADSQIAHMRQTDGASTCIQLAGNIRVMIRDMPA